MRSNVSIIKSNSGPNSRFRRLQDQVVGVKYDNNAPNSRRPFCEATSLSSAGMAIRTKLWYHGTRTMVLEYVQVYVQI